MKYEGQVVAAKTILLEDVKQNKLEATKKEWLREVAVMSEVRC